MGFKELMSIEMHDKSDKTYIVLGAPGSATSLISKALEEQGVDMGNCKRSDKEKFYENREFVNFNTKILHSSGGWWGDPPSEEAIDKLDFDNRIQKKIKKYKKSPMWGFKDPRASLTIRKYLKHLEGDVYLICCFRKPEGVIARWKRDGLVTASKELVDRFNQSIINAIKEFVEL